jgi:hypothetical protein
MNVFNLIKYPLTAFLQRQEFNSFVKTIDSFKNDSTLFVFDIDNTLTCTWPSLLIKYPSEEQRVLSLAVNLNSLAYLKSKLVLGNAKVVFLSHRSFKIKQSTIEWLNSVIGMKTELNVYFASSPAVKIKFLEHACRNFSNVELIDDLSFNHERGNRLFYSSVIKSVKSISNLKYNGVEFLDSLDSCNYYFNEII